MVRMVIDHVREPPPMEGGNVALGLNLCGHSSGFGMAVAIDQYPGRPARVAARSCCALNRLTSSVGSV